MPTAAGTWPRTPSEMAGRRSTGDVTRPPGTAGHPHHPHRGCGAGGQREAARDKGGYKALGVSYGTGRASSKHRPGQGPAALPSLLPSCTSLLRETISRAVSEPMPCCGFLPALPFMLGAGKASPSPFACHYLYGNTSDRASHAPRPSVKPHGQDKGVPGSPGARCTSVTGFLEQGHNFWLS